MENNSCSITTQKFKKHSWSVQCNAVAGRKFGTTFQLWNTEPSYYWNEKIWNDSAFTMCENDLFNFVGVLFLSWYYFNKELQLYWDWSNDESTPTVYQAMSKNKLLQIKIFLHSTDLKSKSWLEWQLSKSTTHSILCKRLY